MPIFLQVSLVQFFAGMELVDNNFQPRWSHFSSARVRAKIGHIVEN